MSFGRHSGTWFLQHPLWSGGAKMACQQDGKAWHGATKEEADAAFDKAFGLSDDTLPKDCPQCGTPSIRHVGSKVVLKCKCRTVEASSGKEAVAKWNEA